MLGRYLKNRENTPVKLHIISIFMMAVVFIVDINIPLGVAGGVPYIAVILISLWSPKPAFLIYLAVTCSFLTLLGFYLSPPGGELWKVMANRTLALFAIWVTTVLLLKWKQREDEMHALKSEIENEKLKIYSATINGAQHITNNLLNQLTLVDMEIMKHPGFDEKVSVAFKGMLDEANLLMQSLSSVKTMDDESIRKSVYPK